jgi:tyrosyl-tRNA synthetase
MHFIDLMKSRQQVAQLTHPELLYEHLKKKGRTAYVGMDPTAQSLHVGHLMTIMGLRRWQQCGHRVIALLGGGTAMIGDPSGKTDLRKMMQEEDIARNGERFKGQLAKFIDLGNPAKGLLLNNLDWLKELSYLPFLRQIGPHFSVNRMLTAECFKQRLEKGLSFLEFNYMLLQSYDFLHLNKVYDCTLQMGGDDQWSNMLGGMELIRRLTNSQAFCLTMPLLTTSEGKKMGKTEAGAVWLDPDMTSPYEYYQYWRNVDDSLVMNCLRFFTELDDDRLQGLGQLKGQEINEGKKVLAFEATSLLHGPDEAKKSAATSQGLFTKDKGLGGLLGDEPHHLISKSDFQGSNLVIDLLVVSQICPSKAEARRLIKQGGLTIDGEKIDDFGATLSESDLQKEAGVLVRKGKKHYYRLGFSE